MIFAFILGMTFQYRICEENEKQEIAETRSAAAPPFSPIFLSSPEFLTPADAKFVLVDNLTELRRLCNSENASGCTNQHGMVWLWTGMGPAEFYTACVHEVLHNILNYDTAEETWGTSEEHKIIREIEKHTNFAECKTLTQEAYKGSMCLYLK